jgi:hypothetical protein
MSDLIEPWLSSAADRAEREPADCGNCDATRIVRTGYHGPPGDNRGYIPCPSCCREAFSRFLRENGDMMRGGTFADVYAIAHG